MRFINFVTSSATFFDRSRFFLRSAMAFVSVIVLFLPSSTTSNAAAVLLNEQLGFPSKWQRIQSGARSDMNDVQMLSPTNAWSAGSDGSVLHSLDGGKTWTPKNTGLKGDLNGIFFIDAEHGWVVGEQGESKGVIARTNDGGQTWQLVALKTKRLDAIAFSDAKHGWAAGISGLLFYTSDGGESWQRKKIKSGTDFHHIAFVDPLNGLVVGDAGVIIRTTDGGATWQEVRVEGVNADLYSVSFTSASQVIVAGDDSLVLVSKDGGVSWAQTTVPEEDARVLAAVFTDEANGIASGYDGEIWRTADGGKSWTPEDSGTDASLMVAAMEKNHTIAVGSYGTFLFTENGGKKWQPDSARAGWDLFGIFCFHDKRCLVGGERGRLLVSNDAGSKWSAAQLSPEWRQSIARLAFVDDQLGWAIGTKGLILCTADGGETWYRQNSGTEVILTDVSFLDDKVGWAVGEKGVLLHTTDGGLNWKIMNTGTEKILFRVQAMPDGRALVVGGEGLIFKFDPVANLKTTIASGVNSALLSLTFSTPDRGYASGDDGVVLLTKDQGDTWTALKTGVHDKLWDVGFADVQTGWAVGQDGTILGTRDGGISWARIGANVDSELLAIAPLRGAGAIVIGRKNTIGLLSRDGTGPAIVYAAVDDESLIDGLVRLKVTIGNGSSARITKAQFTAVANTDWKDVGAAVEGSNSDRDFSFGWSFATFDLKPQTEVRFRVFIDDGYTPAGWIDLPLTYRYQPVMQWFWAKYSSVIIPICIPIGIFGCWLLSLTTLLIARPVALVRFGSAEDVFGSSGGGKLAALASAALRLLVLPWFMSLARVRNAWAVEYRAGRVRLSDLAPTIRTRFLDNPEILDVWVEKHYPAVKAALGQLSVYRSRKIYIPLALRVGERDEGELVATPNLSNFRNWFSESRSIITVVAEGGAGKTTVAVALANYAMKDLEKERLTRHRMLPVILERDFSNLLMAVQQDLIRMVGPDAECDAEIVKALMSYRRLLVIADGLSERSTETQRHVCELNFAEIQPNALVVTSRRDLNLGPLAHTAVFLKKIEYAQLIPFIFEFLNRRGLADHFSAAQQLELGKGVISLIGDDASENSFTPLLVTLFVENALANAAATLLPEKLPTSIPGIFLDYIRLLISRNSQISAAPEIIRQAKMLATIALTPDFVPTEFRFQPSDSGNEISGALAVLQAAGIVISRDVAGNEYHLFALDPLAEYLAALDDIDRMGGDIAKWKSHIEKLTMIPGSPTILEGYIVALETSYRTYRRQLNLPAIDFPWKQDLTFPRPAALK
ncbi:hypothetical protein AMC84_PC00020 (plasmid) [Rhizobium phaseoli]|nr:hypothetical protein AMC84_PC00020 [Rhizobium phaseoli]